ncbi:hypothetical protein MMC11_002911 [Xylographa trunciseda]|nr:hypothetical protein [Xylographa trunciseda]
MPPISSLSIYLFGTTAFVAGAAHLVSPQTALSSLDLPASALPAVHGNSLAAIAMGIFYTLAAWQNNRAFYTLSVPMRSLTAAVLWAQGGPWRLVAMWEAAGALLTGTALVWEGRS